MGTPDFCIPVLNALHESEHELVAVYSQPDKPVGRKQIMTPSDVKAWALEKGYEVETPVKIRTADWVEKLKSYNADLFIVAAFGQILSQEVLDIPKYGCVNIHASLLPKYRGASPIQWSIISGDEYTGVTTMQMDKGVDTGDIIMQEKVKIEPTETAETLFEKLSFVGAELCMKTVAAIEDGSAVRTPQDHEAATHVGMLTRETGKLDFSKSANELDCLIRGVTPWPGAYCQMDDKRLKVLEASPVVDDTFDGKNGQIIEVKKDGFLVKCSEGALFVKIVTPEGKKAMNAGDFARGVQSATDIILN